jgi:hypothetical protein
VFLCHTLTIVPSKLSLIDRCYRIAHTDWSRPIHSPAFALVSQRHTWKLWTGWLVQSQTIMYLPTNRRNRCNKCLTDVIDKICYLKTKNKLKNEIQRSVYHNIYRILLFLFQIYKDVSTQYFTNTLQVIYETKYSSILFYTYWHV